MSYGSLLTYPDGTPFYIMDTLPFALIYKRDFSYSANSNTSILLENNTGLPYLYFVRFNEIYSWGYQSPSGNNHSLTVGAYFGDTVSGRIYCFGLQYQPVPNWGVAIWDSQGRCIITNETVVLRGLNSTGASGPANTAKYLDETISGRKAITPGRTGIIVYSTSVGGNIITQLDPHATGCWYENGNTRIRSNPTSRSSASIPQQSTTSNYFLPSYIDCNLYD